jgi:hypothetical protein
MPSSPLERIIAMGRAEIAKTDAVGRSAITSARPGEYNEHLPDGTVRQIITLARMREVAKTATETSNRADNYTGDSPGKPR